jgi:signal-transduction protein with cAMP-binding, CBS, and nucleotidyltransferase domain
VQSSSIGFFSVYLSGGFFTDCRSMALKKEMENKLIEYFSKFRILSKEEKEIITKDLKIVDFKKGTILLKEGQNSYDNYFVLSGCVRQYIIKDGDEKVTKFYTEEDWILPAIGQENNLASKYFLECVEDSFLVLANEKEGSELMKTNPKFQELAQLILEKEIMNQQQHFTEFQNSTPEERYLKLQKTRPDLIERVPQFQLSSYIGVKPESLSRIRKRIAEKRNS